MLSGKTAFKSYGGLKFEKIRGTPPTGKGFKRAILKPHF
jgi:hypothetical protein